MLSETFLYNKITKFFGLDEFTGPNDIFVGSISKSTVWQPPPPGWLK